MAALMLNIAFLTRSPGTQVLATSGAVLEEAIWSWRKLVIVHAVLACSRLARRAYRHLITAHFTKALAAPRAIQRLSCIMSCTGAAQNIRPYVIATRARLARLLDGLATGTHNAVAAATQQEVVTYAVVA